MTYKTAIQIESTTRDRLNNVGMKSETYNEVIKRLLDCFEQKEGCNNENKQLRTFDPESRSYVYK